MNPTFILFALLLTLSGGVWGTGGETIEGTSGRLSAEELKEIEIRVLSRCGLGKNTLRLEAPWYFHFELARELERRGDSQRALDALIEATRRRPRPGRAARMYGMWFIDYRPYLRMARLQATLGNWDCVVDALRLADSFGEVRMDDREIVEYDGLRREVEARQVDGETELRDEDPKRREKR